MTVDINLCAPGYKRGHELREGTFWRNLDGKVKPRYHDDESYGHKFDPRPDQWRWTYGDELGLSVNLSTCVDAVDSPSLHPEPKRFHHVVAIDLRQLSHQLEMTLVAQYTPIGPPDPPPANPCHFDIIPEGGRLEDLLVALKRLAMGEPEGDWPKKTPRTQDERRRAEVCIARWKSVFPELVPVDANAGAKPAHP